jgi:hypothetical protein
MPSEIRELTAAEVECVSGGCITFTVTPTTNPSPNFTYHIDSDSQQVFNNLVTALRIPGITSVSIVPRPCDA